MYTYSVIGTGAVGGYYGGRLAEAGNPVQFLARSDYEYIKQYGLTVDSCQGNFRLHEVDVHNSCAFMIQTDVVIISLKTTANSSLKTLLDPLIGEGTIILVLQNGLGMEAELQELYPEAVIVGGMCFICSQKLNPGRISHLDYGSVTIGVQDGGKAEILANLKADFEQAKVPVTVSSNLGEARWRKLLWNIPYNGTSVILRADTKKIMDTPSSRRIIRRLMDEVVLGAAACGHVFEADAVDKMMEYTDKMTAYEPSMKLDFDQRRLMEIEYMYLKPLAAAREMGVALPAIDMIAEQLIFIEESWALDGRISG